MDERHVRPHEAVLRDRLRRVAIAQAREVEAEDARAVLAKEVVEVHRVMRFFADARSHLAVYYEGAPEWFTRPYVLTHWP